MTEPALADDVLGAGPPERARAMLRIFGLLVGGITAVILAGVLIQVATHDAGGPNTSVAHQRQRISFECNLPEAAIGANPIGHGRSTATIVDDGEYVASSTKFEYYEYALRRSAILPPEPTAMDDALGIERTTDLRPTAKAFLPNGEEGPSMVFADCDGNYGSAP